MHLHKHKDTKGLIQIPTPKPSGPEPGFCEMIQVSLMNFAGIIGMAIHHLQIPAYISCQDAGIGPEPLKPLHSLWPGWTSKTFLPGATLSSLPVATVWMQTGR